MVLLDQILVSLPGLPDSWTFKARVRCVLAELRSGGSKVQEKEIHTRGKNLSVKMEKGTLFVFIGEAFEEWDVQWMVDYVRAQETTGERKTIAIAIHQLFPKGFVRTMLNTYNVRIFDDRRVGDIVSRIKRLSDSLGE